MAEKPVALDNLAVSDNGIICKHPASTDALIVHKLLLRWLAIQTPLCPHAGSRKFDAAGFAATLIFLGSSGTSSRTKDAAASAGRPTSVAEGNLFAALGAREFFERPSPPGSYLAFIGTVF